MSDEVIRRRTGRGWEQWFDILDEWGATERPHKEIARWLVDEHGVDGWGAQSVTVSYERARGMRAVGERANGFSITASKTVAVPVERLYDAFVDETLRAALAARRRAEERTATKPRSARFDWGDGATRVIVGFEAKGESKSLAALEHERLPDGEEAERMKAFWRERVAALKEVLEVEASLRPSGDRRPAGGRPRAVEAGRGAGRDWAAGQGKPGARAGLHICRADAFSGDPPAHYRGVWRRGCPVGLSQLRYLRIGHYGFDRRVHTGEMIVHRSGVRPMERVFASLYRSRFPIRRMRLVNDYGGGQLRRLHRGRQHLGVQLPSGSPGRPRSGRSTPTGGPSTSTRSRTRTCRGGRPSTRRASRYIDRQRRPPGHGRQR